MKDFRNRVVSGSIWNIGASVVRYGFDVAVNIILARLLLPEDFGVVAMATVMSGAVGALGQLGWGTALVQRKQLTEAHRSSVFWITMGLGFVLAGVTVASGPVVAWFYDEPLLTQLMPVVAIQFPLTGLAVIPQAELSRELRFGDLAKVNLIAIFVSGVAGVAAAGLGGGVWAILLRSLLIHFITAFGLVAIVRWRPRWTFRWAAIRELLSFSVNLYFNQIFVYVSRNLDTVLIGKFLGSSPLGVYSRSYTLMTLPMQTMTHAVFRVLFSAFSAIQDDSERIRRVYLQYSGALATFVVPSMMGLAAVAHPAVVAALGPEWATLAPVVQIMAPAAMWQGVAGIHRVLYLSQGRTDLQLRYTIIGRGCVLIGIVAGLSFGINGVAAGFVAGSFIDTVLGVHMAGRLVGLTWGQLLSHHRGVLLSALGMGGVVVAVGRLPAVSALSEWGQLGVLVPIGITIYAGSLLIFEPKPYLELKALVDNRLKARRKEK